MCGLGHHRPRHQALVQGDHQRLGTGNRPEEREHEVGEDVAVTIERGDHERVAARRQQERERRVDQLGLVSHGRVPLRRRVHLLFQHSFVDRADRVLRAAEDLRACALGELEREFGNGATDRALDPLGAERRLVFAFALAPLFRPVGAADGHPDDRDRRVNTSERSDAGNPPASADDHAAPDLFAQDPVWRADIVGSLGRDRGGFQPQSGLPERGGRLVDDPVLRRPS